MRRIPVFVSDRSEPLYVSMHWKDEEQLMALLHAGLNEMKVGAILGDNPTGGKQILELRLSPKPAEPKT